MSNEQQMTLREEYWEWAVRILKGEAHPDKAKTILFRIVSDFTDRRGLRQEWEQIDNGIQDEIMQEWLGIIERGIQ
jgi:hypothetical protein